MDLDELKETKVWELYQKHVDFMHLRGIYTDTDVNYRMYNGDQWHGAKLGNIEKSNITSLSLLLNTKYLLLLLIYSLLIILLRI